uniref:Uncharacterized protein n=1 Tax=Arundo donax TaxID=35708 RepID=A0A0A9H9G0_ARUDO
MFASRKQNIIGNRTKVMLEQLSFRQGQDSYIHSHQLELELYRTQPQKYTHFSSSAVLLPAKYLQPLKHPALEKNDHENS